MTPTLPAEWIYNVQEVAERTYTCEIMGGWKRAAREASRVNRGQVWPGSASMTLVCGAHKTWLLSPDAWEKAQGARGICSDLNVQPGATVGGCARKLLSFIGPAQSYTEQEWRDEEYWDVQPGQYDHAVLWDVQSCYYALLNRTPSLRVSLTRGGLCWQRMDDGEEGRRRDVFAAIGHHKPLRNSLVGSARGKLTQSEFFRAGEVVKGPRMPGPFANIAILIRRSAFELCRETSEEAGSVYSNVDCIMAEDAGYIPRAWRAVGLKTRVVAEGASEVCSHGIYRIGSKATELYRRGYRFTARRARSQTPFPLLYREWL